jgi:hypothetical protein
MTGTFLAILGTPLLLAIPSHAEGKWQLTPAPRPPSLAGFMEAADLSGIALSGKYAAISSDELAFAQFGSFQPESDTIQFSTTIGNVSAPGGKAEGLLVLEDAATSVHIAIIHDGIDQGGTTSYFLRRTDAPSAP